MNVKRLLLLVILVVFCGQMSAAQNTLTGVASYHQLSKEYYLAGLYTETAMDSREQILADKNPKKMVIKVTATRWSLRSFKKVWRQDLSINNDLSKDLELTNAISQFINFPAEPLRKGDEIIIELSQAQHTVVWLNEEKLLSYDNEKLFNALLNTWLGEVPPSRLFQSDILTIASIVTSEREHHKARFNQSEIPAQRVGIVSQWQNQKKLLAETQQAAKLAQQEKLRKAAELKAQLAKRKEAERQQALLAAKQKTAKTASTKTTPEITEKNSKEKPEQELIATLVKLEAEAKLQQYMIDLYQWQVAELVSEQVEYPLWAKEFNLSGKVTIEFVVQANGQLVGISDIVPSDSGLLGQALQTGLAQAAPFDAFSDRLKAKELVLTVTHEFHPNNDKSVVHVKPKAPEDLQQLIALVG